ncbi:hypothetical protein AVEN_16078-1, partial [Araneus ventricosus]
PLSRYGAGGFQVRNPIPLKILLPQASSRGAEDWGQVCQLRCLCGL